MSPRRYFFAPFTLALWLSSTAAIAQTPSPITLDQAMAHPDWIGNPVETAWWAWDNQRVYFTQKRPNALIRDTYSLPVSGGTAKVMSDAEASVADASTPVFDRAQQRFLFVRNGDIYLRDLRSGLLQQLTRSNEDEAEPRFSADQTQVLWRVGNDWFRATPGHSSSAAALPRAEKNPNEASKPEGLSAQSLRLSSVLQREKDQVAALRTEAERMRKADPTRAIAPAYLGDDINLIDSALSPSGRWLLAVVEAKSSDAGRVGKMPKYITQSGYEEAEDVRQRVGQNAPVAQSLRLLDVSSGAVRTVDISDLPDISNDPLAALRKGAGQTALTGPRGVRITGLRWNDSGTQLAVQLRSIDNKDRWLALLDSDDAKLRSLHHLHDAAWINWNYNEFGWLPDDKTLWLLSEESGWSHLYTVSAGKKAQALTSGEWEVSSPQLSRDGKVFYFVCNRQRPGDYELCEKNIDDSETRELSQVDGVEDFSISPDGKHILLRISSSYTPAQLAVMPSSGGEAKTLTDTRSDAYKARRWIKPEIVQVPSKHGAGVIWGKLYRPEKLAPDKKYPIVMFVHGAGYLQNVHSRFPVYFREQMFHNLLVQSGYIVLDLDYRASEGYGRDWRTAIYRQMGHPELEDYLDGVDYLIETQQGDGERVGIYGGSYGGFMAFMGLFRAPDVFKAGAALRPVSDWTSYNHEYTSNILNTPDLDPEAYRISSPIEYVDQFRGQLLISHGMIDDNVLYQDSVRMAQRLIELKKDHWELASYPLERHAYQHPESWYDQYRRIYQLFERSLK